MTDLGQLPFTDTFAPGDAHPQTGTAIDRCSTILSARIDGNLIFAHPARQEPQKTNKKNIIFFMAIIFDCPTDITIL